MSDIPLNQSEEASFRSILDDSVTRLFTDHVDKPTRETAEQRKLSQPLWEMVEEMGLAGILTADDSASGSWQSAGVVLQASGRFAVPLPLAETILAHGILTWAGLPIPPGPLSVALPNPKDAPHTTSFTRVPWAASVAHLVCVTSGTTYLLPRDAVAIETESANIAKEPRDTVHCRFDAAIARSDTGPPAQTVFSLAALVRAAQMAGALETLLQQSVQYAQDRVQFGRPLAKFQAIQQQLAALAGDAAAAAMATSHALAAAERVSSPAALADIWFDIAAAKCRTEDAAGRAAAVAHQVHGAIGFTYEHELHYYTRRLWSWRSEYGNQQFWAAKLGAHARDLGGESLWHCVTER